MRVQLQLDGHGERVAEIVAWFNENCRHVDADVRAQPGVTIAMTIPRDHYDTAESWLARFHEATGPMDVALEILSDCFASLGLPPARVLSVHLTAD